MTLARKRVHRRTLHPPELYSSGVCPNDIAEGQSTRREQRASRTKEKTGDTLGCQGDRIQSSKIPTKGDLPIDAPPTPSSLRHDSVPKLDVS